MCMLPQPDQYGDILKLVQTGFYIVGAIIAILTYRAARRGLLNSVNTEYQKRVMDRLQKLSEELYSEFDPSSPNYWARSNPMRDAMQQMNKMFMAHRDLILKVGRFAP